MVRFSAQGSRAAGDPVEQIGPPSHTERSVPAQTERQYFVGSVMPHRPSEQGGLGLSPAISHRGLFKPGQLCLIENMRLPTGSQLQVRAVASVSCLALAAVSDRHKTEVLGMSTDFTPDPDDVSPETLASYEKKILDLLHRLSNGVSDAEGWAMIEQIMDEFTMKTGPSANHLFRPDWREAWGDPDEWLGTALLGHFEESYGRDWLTAFNKVYVSMVRYLLDRKTRRRIEQNRSRLKEALADCLDLRGHTVPGSADDDKHAPDPVEECLTGQPLEIYRFLRERKHWTDYKTLRGKHILWRKPNPEDSTISRALRRLQAELNGIDGSAAVKIEKMAKRTKLDKPST